MDKVGLHKLADQLEALEDGMYDFGSVDKIDNGCPKCIAGWAAAWSGGPLQWENCCDIVMRLYGLSEEQADLLVYGFHGDRSVTCPTRLEAVARIRLLAEGGSL